MKSYEDLVKGDFQLPSLPEVAMRILETVKQDDFSFNDLGRIISSDPGLTAKILKMANSSFYGLTQKVSSIEKAISILGATALKNVALSFVIAREFRKNASIGFDFDYFWKRAVTAAIAADLTGKLTSARNDDLFVAGLLMDIGVIIMYMTRPEEYLQVLYEKKLTDLPLERVEKGQFGIDHSRVSAEVLEKWGLAQAIFNPIALHHAPGEISYAEKNTAGILSIADQISSAYHGSRKNYKMHAIKETLEKDFGITEEKANRLIDNVAEKSLEVFSFFEIHSGDMKPYSQILQEANVELGRLVFSYEQLLMNFKEEKERAEALARELKEKNEILRNLSVRDGLTGLFNHKYFQEFLDQELSRSIRYKRPFSLIMFDLDHFKKINDSFGHRTGDIVLQKIGETVLDLIRKNDVAARYGGEEFAVILPETDVRGGLVIAERMRKAIEQLTIVEDSNLLKVTVSMGVSTYQPEAREKTKAQLIDAADSAMYQAKQSGRNKLGYANFQ
ncbi:MAG: GGDEF domain-containing protein [Proteobacteria bacterium]|nr:GGDEF domain-containing protein [Pseudomonadota bacterium]MBU4472327.1 GGDEF domain-containing protein [Pseudomonadota bacterium]MCG2752023.1 GGDEF domain-containing protein [Desulfobacteraceae bacterium]